MLRLFTQTEVILQVNSSFCILRTNVILSKHFQIYIGICSQTFPVLKTALVQKKRST